MALNAFAAPEGPIWGATMRNELIAGTCLALLPLAFTTVPVQAQNTGDSAPAIQASGSHFLLDGSQQILTARPFERKPARQRIERPNCGRQGICVSVNARSDFVRNVSGKRLSNSRHERLTKQRD